MKRNVGYKTYQPRCFVHRARDYFCCLISLPLARRLGSQYQVPLSMCPMTEAASDSLNRSHLFLRPKRAVCNSTRFEIENCNTLHTESKP